MPTFYPALRSRSSSSVTCVDVVCAEAPDAVTNSHAMRSVRL